MANSDYIFRGDLVRIGSPSQAITGSVLEKVGDYARIGQAPNLTRLVAISELQLCILGPRHFATYLLDGRPKGWEKTRRWFAVYSHMEIRNRILLRLSSDDYMQKVLSLTEAASYPSREYLRPVARQVFEYLDRQVRDGYYVDDETTQAS